MGVGLPGQRDAVLGHVSDYGFVRRAWQLEGLRGLRHRRVCTLWMARGENKDGGRNEEGGEIQAETGRAQGAHLMKL